MINSTTKSINSAINLFQKGGIMYSMPEKKFFNYIDTGRFE